MELKIGDKVTFPVTVIHTGIIHKVDEENDTACVTTLDGYDYVVTSNNCRPVLGDD